MIDDLTKIKVPAKPEPEDIETIEVKVLSKIHRSTRVSPNQVMDDLMNMTKSFRMATLFADPHRLLRTIEGGDLSEQSVGTFELKIRKGTADLIQGVADKYNAGIHLEFVS